MNARRAGQSKISWTTRWNHTGGLRGICEGGFLKMTASLGGQRSVCVGFHPADVNSSNIDGAALDGHDAEYVDRVSKIFEARVGCSRRAVRDRGGHGCHPAFQYTISRPLDDRMLTFIRK